jgi:hypothetical protein
MVKILFFESLLETKNLFLFDQKSLLAFQSENFTAETLTEKELFVVWTVNSLLKRLLTQLRKEYLFMYNEITLVTLIIQKKYLVKL